MPASHAEPNVAIRARSLRTGRPVDDEVDYQVGKSRQCQNSTRCGRYCGR